MQGAFFLAGGILYCIIPLVFDVVSVGLCLSQDLLEVVRQLPDGVKIESSSTNISLRINSEGFWCSARLGKLFYRRCMDGRVLSSASGEILSERASVKIDRDVSVHCQKLLANPGNSFDVRVLALLLKASQLSDDEFGEQSKIYNSVYPESVPVLPPDRYRDLVVPLSTGCPNGKCTFCAFYQDRPFVLLDDKTLQSRLDGLLNLVPSGLANREGVFIGSANALAIPVSRLSAMLQVVAQRLGNPARGVACFGDADFMGRRSVADWILLREQGLEQVVIGLETGFAELRKSLGKKGDLNHTRKLVAQLKQAGIRVGLTVLTGVCEKYPVACHINETVEYIQSLNLTAADRAYISPWFSESDLPKPEALHEAEELKNRLKAVTEARVTLYSSHNFYYYS